MPKQFQHYKDVTNFLKKQENERKQRQRQFEARQHQAKKECTIIRVWLPTDKNGNFTVAHEAVNVGHASLQTGEIYASFWPDWEVAKKAGKLKALLGEAKGVLIPNVQTDIALEEKEPEVTIVLYSLDVKEINKKFKEFSASSTSVNWSLMGRNVFNVFNKGGGQSCSGLVYDLLNAGDTKKLLSWDFISNVWTVAPDAVARVAVEAAKSATETQLAYNSVLPPGISKRITKPDFDLNPHSWKIGYAMGDPKSTCSIS